MHRNALGQLTLCQNRRRQQSRKSLPLPLVFAKCKSLCRKRTTGHTLDNWTYARTRTSGHTSGGMGIKVYALGQLQSSTMLRLLVIGCYFREPLSSAEMLWFCRIFVNTVALVESSQKCCEMRNGVWRGRGSTDVIWSNHRAYGASFPNVGACFGRPPQ